MTSISEKSQASDFKPFIFEAKPDPELIIKSILEHFPYLKFRNSFSRGDHHALFAMENMEIMDYMAHGTARMIPKNIVLPAILLDRSCGPDHLKCAVVDVAAEE